LWFASEELRFDEIWANGSVYAVHGTPEFYTVNTQIGVLVLTLLIFAVGCEPANTGATAEPPREQFLAANASPAVKKIIEQMSSPVAEERAAAARQLRGLGEEAYPAIHALVVLLGDESGSDNPSESPAMMALETLAAIGEPAVPSLLAALPQTTPETRANIVSLLESSDNPQVPETLVAMLDDDDSDTRLSAVWAVHRMKIHTPKAIGLLIGLLRDDNLNVAHSASIALAEARDRRAVEPLLALLHDTRRDISLRSDAATALGCIGDPLAFDPLLKIVANTKTDSRLRASAAHSIAYFRDQRALSALRAMLKESDESLRADAIQALGIISLPGAMETLLAMVQNREERPHLRAEAIRYLSYYDSPRVVKVKIAVFEEVKSAVFENAGEKRQQQLLWTAALDFLALSSKREAYQRAIEALSDPDAEVRYMAVRVFAECLPITGDVAWGDSDSTDDRARVLPAHKDPRMPDALIAIIKDPDEDEYTRKLAARALVKTGDARATKLLKELEVK